MQDDGCRQVNEAVVVERKPTKTVNTLQAKDVIS